MSTRTIIITGASRGLGAAAARIAAGMGANVVLNARSADDLASVAQDIRDAGGQAEVVPGDVSQPEVIRALVERALARFGGLDALVNNAGVIEPVARIADADPEAWQRNWAINVHGPFMLTQAALPSLRERGGRVVSVSSGAAVKPKGGWAAYCASKAALNLFTGVLALEEDAITALAFRPGLVDTAMQTLIRERGAAGMLPDEHARFVNHHRAGDLNPPELAGRALAVLALHAPHEWSGSFVRWDDDAVQALVEERAP